jgi:hypothetical protein
MLTTTRLVEYSSSLSRVADSNLAIQESSALDTVPTPALEEVIAIDIWSLPAVYTWHLNRPSCLDLFWRMLKRS